METDKQLMPDDLEQDIWHNQAIVEAKQGYRRCYFPQPDLAQLAPLVAPLVALLVTLLALLCFSLIRSYQLSQSDFVTSLDGASKLTHNLDLESREHMAESLDITFINPLDWPISHVNSQMVTIRPNADYFKSRYPLTPKIVLVREGAYIRKGYLAISTIDLANRLLKVAKKSDSKVIAEPINVDINGRDGVIYMTETIDRISYTVLVRVSLRYVIWINIYAKENDRETIQNFVNYLALSIVPVESESDSLLPIVTLDNIAAILEIFVLSISWVRIYAISSDKAKLLAAMSKVTDEHDWI